MNKLRLPSLMLAILGGCLLLISLMTGCAWSVEGEGFRAESRSDDTQDEEAAPGTQE